MTAHEISRALHGRPNGRGFLCRCPLRSHGAGKGDRNPSLSIADGTNGNLIFKCFAGCDPRDVLAELRRRDLLESFRDGGRQLGVERQPISSPEPELDAKALALWRQAIPAPSTLAEQYLRARGITLPIPPTLRFIQYVDYMPRVGFPAMVAAVQRPDRAIVAVQLTFLDPRGGRKASVTTPRKTVGRLGSGAVRLGAAAGSLGLAGGVETALSAMQLSGVPVWACLGSCRMAAVSIPSHVRSLCVFADNDAAGRSGAQNCVERHRADREAFAQIPPTDDWNSYLETTDQVAC